MRYPAAMFSQPPVPIVATVPSVEASVHVRIPTGAAGTLTDDIHAGDMLDVWAPSPGHRFVLKGGFLCALVTTELVAAGADVLMLLDHTLAGGCVHPIAPFGPTDRAGTLLTDGVVRFDLPSGHTSSAKDNVLRVGANAAIGTGVIRITGTLWGDEVPL